MKALFRILGIVLAIFVVVPLLAFAVLWFTFDPNNYKPQIAEALSKQLGREVTLAGPLSFGLSWDHGLSLTAEKIQLANPAWASRPQMAEVGTAELGLNVQALLAKRVQITGLKLLKADIQLETSPQGQNNWEFKQAAKQNTEAPVTPSVAERTHDQKVQAVKLQVDQVTISDSVLAVRSREGKITSLKISRLTVDDSNNQSRIDFEGDYAGQPLKLAITGTAIQNLLAGQWPFQANIRFGAISLVASGTYENGAQRLKLDSYTLQSGATKATGAMTVGLGGTRPLLQGSINADKIDPNNLGNADQATPANAGPSVSNVPNAPQRLFNDQPLPLDGLRAVDARLDIAVGEIALPNAALRQLQTQLELANGRLELSPLAFMLADSRIDGNLVLDGSRQQAQLATRISAPQLTIGALLPPQVASAFNMKADLAADIQAQGNSPHALASTANGTLNLAVAGAQQNSRNAGSFVSAILSAAVPGSENFLRADLNCMAARFRLADGLMRSQGLLIDTTQATLAGEGEINLANETMNILMNIRAKAINIAQYTPSLRITGPLLRPNLSPDRASIAEKVAGAVLGSRLPALTNAADAVPVVNAVPGQNACVYALDHPQAAAAPASASNATGQPQKPADQIRELGGKLLNNLFGK